MAKFKVYAAKANKGVLDNGQEYDYTRLGVMFPVAGVNASGFDIVYVDCGNSEVYHEMQLGKIQYPVEMELNFIQTVSPSGMIKQYVQILEAKK